MNVPMPANPGPARDVGSCALWHVPAPLQEEPESAESEVTAFLCALCDLIKARLVLECGTYRGRTTLALARALRAWGGEVIGVELDRAAAEATRLRVRELDNVAVVEADAESYFPPGIPDLVFIDSSGPLPGDKAAQHRGRVLDRYLGTARFVAVHDASDAMGLRGLLRARPGGIYFRSPCGLALWGPPV